MAERREGDWDCPDCGALVFASKDTCFKCDRAAGGGKGGKDGKERREGDWNCPDCGTVVFASKDTCFKCDRAAGGGKGGKERREGDWDCPVCGALIFASKDTCFKCDRAAAMGGAVRPSRPRKEGDWDCPDCGMVVFADKDICFKCKGKGKGRGQETKPVSADVREALPGDPIKALAKASPAFKKAWVAYCKQSGEGTSDPSKHDQAFITAFAEYIGGVLVADMQKPVLSVENGDDDEEEAPATATSKKRPAVPAEPLAKKAAKADGRSTPSAPDEKKQITIKKCVGDEIRRLNAGGLALPIRPGAVASALALLSDTQALEALQAVEGQEEIEDPNVFIVSLAKDMAAAL